MNRCRQSERVQDYLDRALDAAAEERFQAHLEGCAACAGELAAYMRVFSALDDAPLADPGPRFAERVLAQVLPSRVRRRRMAAAGAAYAGALAVSLAGLAALFGMPAGRALVEGASGDVSRRLVHFGVFLLNAIEFAVLRMADGWIVVDTVAERFAPFARALNALLSQPAIALTLWAAVVGTVVVLWWMRPRFGRDRGGARHVGLLGF
jgi:predicted anti-sigma-YlaC factor YlaD